MNIFGDLNLGSTIIGTQEWLSSNLCINTFKNGDIIPEAKSIEQWIGFIKDQRPCFCHFMFDKGNLSEYGLIYNWFAINDQRGLAPDGWHIPSQYDLEILVNFLGDGSGQKLKSTKGWGKMNGKNEFGFSGDCCGYLDVEFYSDCNQYRYYFSIAKVVAFWASDVYNKNENRFVTFTLSNYRDDLCICGFENFFSGCYLRCLKYYN